ncbi:MAG: 30S ribosomal protein S16 [bacterium]|uniref:Small ribosomal subunit protein bS16 n=2 Tax=Bacteria candidate phyla TaxID=1783234 RepID=A0A348MKG2_UNCW3|nr:30S ribosomal protein S16 [bacterium]HAF07538.1 30S ribosomal protein S16 [candidate division WOR-3 bacterium]HCP17607.1 30S ribosomal protein S16 [candidate division WOR-3 bacterium]
MMVNIHLKRIGKKKTLCYRVVVADSRFPRDGRFIDSIGSYDPKGKNLTKLDLMKYDAWIKKGAKPTKRVESIIKLYRENKLEGKVEKDEITS